MVEINCSFCNKIFKKRKSRLKYSKNHYCSIECCDIHKKETMKGKNNHRYGSTLSEEAKKFRSDFMKEKWQDEKYVEKVLKSREETRQKTSVPIGWDAKSIEKRKTTLLKKFGVEHNWSSGEIRKRCEETNLKRYGKTSIDLMQDGITKEVIEKRRKTLIETMLGISYEEYEKSLTEREKYYKMVRRITEAQPLHLLENYEKRGHYGDNKACFHLDHIIPIAYGFQHDIPPEIIGDISNLRFIPWRENIVKGCKLPPKED